MRATAPHSHGASSRPPASRSCSSEARMSACRPSANARRLVDEVVRRARRRAARPGCQVSRIACSNSQRRSGSARTTPSGARATAVALDSPTRKTNFSQFARTMSSGDLGVDAGAPGRRQERLRAARCAGISGPNCMRAIWPVCSITPGRLDARGDVGRAAHHRRFGQHFAQALDRLDAVLERDHHRVACRRPA